MPTVPRRSSNASTSTARGRPRRRSQFNHLTSALEHMVNVRGDLANDRSKFRREFLPPMMVTLVSASLITLVTSSIDSWMTPLIGQKWFTQMWTNTFARHENIFLGTCVVGACFIYITDMRYWRRCWKYLFFPLVTTISLSVLLWASLSNQPILCLSLSIAACVVASFSMRRRLFPSTPKKFTAYGECLAFTIVSLGLLAIWLYWFFTGGGERLKRDDIWESGEAVRTVSPAIKSGAYAMVAYFALLRSRWHGTSKAEGTENQESTEVDLGVEFKVSMIVLVSLAGMAWATVFLGIGDPNISQFMGNIAVLLLFCIVVYIVRWIGIKKLKKLAQENETLAAAVGVLTSDWFKAVFFVFLGWVLPVAIFIEIVHQLVRLRLEAMGLLILEDEEDLSEISPPALSAIQEEGTQEELERAASALTASTAPKTMELSSADRSRSRWWTSEMEDWLGIIGRWNITSILNKCILLGLGIYGFRVLFMKGLNVFIVYVNAYLMRWSLRATVVMLAVILFSLFQIPGMAGFLLYLTASLILIPKYMRLNRPSSPSTRLALGCIMSTTFCLVVKLIACTFQMKFFGGRYKNDPAVKKMIGLHTQFMKAVKYILTEPGNYLAKVSILVGCPDWPVSVTTGIMDLQLVPMIIGTLPVILIIMPSCASSAFLLCPQAVQDEGVLSPGLCTAAQGLCLLIVGVAQYAFQFLAIYYSSVLLSHLQQKQGELGPDWMKDPQEDEILVLVAIDERKNALYQESVKYEKLPSKVRAALWTGMFLSCIIVGIDLWTKAYADVDISKLPRENFGRGSHWIRIVYWQGWVQTAAFALDLLCYCTFTRWVSTTVPDFNDSLPSNAVPLVEAPDADLAFDRPTPSAPPRIMPDQEQKAEYANPAQEKKNGDLEMISR